MARIPVNCGCEDAPCCGCNEVALTGEDALNAIREDEDLLYISDEPDDSMDGDFDTAMASAGFGTDEDYGFYPGCDEVD